MYRELEQLPGLCIWGPQPNPDWHTPTISFTIEGQTPVDTCRLLAEKGICAWDGNFYAQRAIEILGLAERGGVTRFGISLYTSQKEVEYVNECMTQLANQVQLRADGNPLHQMESKP